MYDNNGLLILASNTLQVYLSGDKSNWRSKVLRDFVLACAPGLGVKFEKHTLMAVSVHNNNIMQPKDCYL